MIADRDERAQLARWKIGGQPFAEWLAASAPDQACAMLVRILDRYGPRSLPARVIAEHLGADPHQVYARNWPRKAARLAAQARDRGDQPHADRLHAALVALMFCANCGRPLDDPRSVDRGIGPDCWENIDPAWRASIEARQRITEGTPAS